MSDVVVIATLHPAPGRIEEVLEVIRGNVPTVHAEDGCLLYAVNRVGTDPEVVVFVERWTTPEALAAHGASAHMAATGEKLAPLLAGSSEVRVGSAVPAGDTVKGAV